MVNLSSTLVQKWGAIHWLKSLWDFKSEIGSLHFSGFILIKNYFIMGSLYKHHISLLIDIIHYYNLPW